MRLLPESYDRTKPVIVMGKGPTCRQIDRSDDYYVACANQAGRLAEHVDFQFGGDGGYFIDCLEAYADKIDNVIVPTQFHLENPKGLRSLDFVSEKGFSVVDGKIRINDRDIEVFEYLFQFHKERYPDVGPEVREYDVCSTGEAAMKWLVDEGFATIKCVGFDAEQGDHSRHATFLEAGDCRIWPTGGTWAQQTFERAVNYVRSKGGTVEKI